MHEHDVLQAFNNGVDMPCIVHWALLWYPASTRMTADLVIEGRVLESYSRDTAVALESTFNIPMLNTSSPKRFFLTA